MFAYLGMMDGDIRYKDGNKDGKSLRSGKGREEGGMIILRGYEWSW